ncbi:hypothetical protein [Sulfurospirillum multivorans]|uniref:Uncharacterized protein n=2 Tax=Sulfurospirillum multivorans TaxID=66821 RepID=A0AA86DYE3_SULMK|nr:hypothetical protein [Sulfurospirillum multivorans]AHJ13113.1 hypothetical protein SMUL_1858 [Sulfurospirillum multivorans DSM 12446]QEH06601.1 hypothetical protein SMN_1836 [Sulfurospirillum multivorans]
MAENENPFITYLDTKRVIKICTIFACACAVIMIGFLTSPSENKGFTAILAILGLLIVCIGMVAYVWADFVEWKKDKKDVA